MSKVILQKNRETELPKGWVDCKFEDISIRLNAGGTPSTKNKKYYENGTIPFVKINDITNSQKYLISTEIKITEEGLKNSSAWIVPKNSILYSMYASYGIPIINRIEVATSQAIITYIPPKDLIILEFVYYYLLSIKDKLIPKGTTQANMNAGLIREIQVLLPPLNEQKRIVSKIEELFSLIDNIRKIIKIAQQQIPKLMQKTIDDSTSTNVKDSQVYRLGEIADIKGGVTLGRKLKGETIKLPYLRVANVQDGYVDLNEIKEIEVLETEREKWLLQSGDILLTEGGDRDKLGRGTVWQNQVSPCIHQNHIFRVRLNKKLFNPDFVSLVLRSSRSKSFFQKVGKQTVNLASINKTQLSSFKFLCPDITIQEYLSEKILRSIDHLNYLEKLSDELEKKIQLLQNQVLIQAFDGKLVSQDPNDEPAEILLQKIKQEKEKAQENQRVIKVKSIKSRRTKNAK